MGRLLSWLALGLCLRASAPSAASAAGAGQPPAAADADAALVRRVTAEALLAEEAWGRSCPVPGEDGLCTETTRESGSYPQRLKVRAGLRRWALERMARYSGRPVPPEALELLNPCGPPPTARVQVHRRDAALAREAARRAALALSLYQRTAAGAAAARDAGPPLPPPVTPRRSPAPRPGYVTLVAPHRPQTAVRMALGKDPLRAAPPPEPPQEELRAMRVHVARVLLLQADQALEELLALEVPGPTYAERHRNLSEAAQRSDQEQLDSLMSKLHDVQRRYALVIRAGSPAWTLTAAMRAGLAAQHAERELYYLQRMDEPTPPRGVTMAAHWRRYRDAQERVRCHGSLFDVLRERAKEELTYCFEQARLWHVQPEGLERCERALSDLDPGGYLPLREIYAEPGPAAVSLLPAPLATTPPAP